MGTKVNMVMSKPKIWKLVIVVLSIVFVVNLFVLIEDLKEYEPYTKELFIR